MNVMIDISKVASVYSGKDGKCCCGCNGKHYYPTSQAALAEKRGGTVSDRMVKTIVNRLNAAWEHRIHGQVGSVEDLGSCHSIVVGSRVYIVYFIEEPDQPTLREALEDAAS